MTERLTNIELLVMLSEDVRAQGDDLSAEMQQRGAAHARRVIELLVMLDKARESLEREKARYSHYLPTPQQREPVRVMRQQPRSQLSLDAVEKALEDK